MPLLSEERNEPASISAAFPLFGASNIKDQSNLSFSRIKRRPSMWPEGVFDGVTRWSGSSD